MINKKFCMSFREDPETIDFQGKDFHFEAALIGESSSVLVLSVYREKTWSKEQREPLFRHFVEKGGYITYFSSGKKSVASINYITWFGVCWAPYIYNVERKYSFNENFAEVIHQFLEKVGFWEQAEDARLKMKELSKSERALRAVGIYEEQLLKEKLNNRHNAIKKRIDERMEQVPEIPGGYEGWLKEEVFRGERYIYYDAQKRKKPGQCSYCGHVAEYPNAKREQEGTCKGCGSKITFYPGRKTADYQKKISTVIIQRTEEGLLFRRFVAHCTHRKNGEPFRMQDIEFFETDRCFWGLEDGVYFSEDGYSYQNFKQTGEFRWCESGDVQERNLYGMVYPENLREVLGDTAYRYSALPEYVDHSQDQSFLPLRYLRQYEKHPELEYVVKRGYYSIANSLIRWWGDGEIVERIHNLPKPYQKLLRREDGNIEFLTFLEEVEANQLSMSDEEILRARELSDGNDRIIKILTHTTITKLSNYLKRQERKAEEEIQRTDPWAKRGSTVHRAQGKQGSFSIYADYFNFCEELGKNVDHDFVLYPRDLIGAHDELVKEVLELREREKKKRLKQCDQLMKDRHGALSEKYGFEDGGLKIVVPKSKRELEKEGEAMRNCVGTYLERMAKGECTVLFVRKTENPKEPYIDIEVKGEKILQCRRKRNEDATNEIQGFLDKFRAERLVAMAE